MQGNPMNRNDELLTPAECAVILRLALPTIRKRIQDRTLESVKIGRAVRVRRSAVEQLIKDSIRPAVGDE